jgi:aminoglycoside phosphotransferase family enzyme/predicted kinase
MGSAARGGMVGDAQREVIEFLSRPEAFGAGPVERIETHASIVFLAGERAWKLKRAVRYSYLDYSTPEKRREACEAELALNRRTAPGLYLEVRAIRRGADGGLTLAAEGEPVDWLLVMRRFPQEALFDRMAQRGALTPALMRDLADAIAAFHDAAEATRDFGGREGMEAMVAGNTANLRLGVPELFAAEAVEALDAASRAAVAAQAALLERRRLDGRVRHCHGDLHLGNICLVDGKPTLFDGIEFNPAIANVDVLYDLSFLLMDLEHRGLGGLGSLVFNRYLDRREEGDGLPALPLFLSVHAAIRAHVGMAAARRASGEAADRQAAAARAYLDLAARLLRPAPPLMVAIGGLSGTGKSTLARALAPCLGAVPGARVLRSDVIRKRLCGRAPEERLPPEAYRPDMDGQVYRAQLAAAGEALAAGQAVILDAVFGRPGEREAAAGLAAALGVPFAGLWLEADAAVLEARIAARRDDASDATVAVVRRQLERDPGPIGWPRLAAGGSLEVLAAAARDAIAAALRQTVG